MRQLRDVKIKPVIEVYDPRMMLGYARSCGWVLARAHARSGDPQQISGYLGSGARFDEALADFCRGLCRSKRSGLRRIRQGGSRRSIAGRRRRAEPMRAGALLWPWRRARVRRGRIRRSALRPWIEFRTRAEDKISFASSGVIPPKRAGQSCERGCDCERPGTIHLNSFSRL